MARTPQPVVRFQDRAEVLDFLLEVAETTSSTLDLGTVLEQLAKAIRRVVPYHVFAILLYSGKSKGLRVRYSIGHRTEVVNSLVIPLDMGLTGAAATSREPVVSGEVTNDPRYLPTVDAVRSELAVPMTARGRLVGVIDLQSTQPNAYTEDDASLLRLIASRVAVSIDNAQLYRSVLRQNRTLRTLTTLAHDFSSTLDLDHLLNRIATTVRKLINYDAFSILLLDQQRHVLRRRFSLRYDERVDLDNIPLGSGITGAAVETREPVVVEDTRRDSRYIESTEGIRSEVAIPLLRPDRVLGVMDIESSRTGFFTEADVRMLTLLAPLVTNSVENARLYEELAERERRTNENLRAARHLQSALLLREPPSVAGLEVAARSRPAHEVSGDVYDFFSPSQDLEIITFGDVSGKGAAAALYGALVNGLLRTLAPRRPGPALLLKSVNDALGERKVRATYVTLLVLYWDHRHRTLRTANAGVLPPIICRHGEILKQRLEGIPLGLLDEIQYDEGSIQTEPGDVLLLFSDGVYEQEDASGEEYGRRRLEALLKEHWRKSPEEILDLVFADMDLFRGAQDIADDQTTVVLKVK